jgi:hypothetical protein
MTPVTLAPAAKPTTSLQTCCSSFKFCQESRNEGLKYYKLFSATKWSDKRVYFSNKLDTLRISGAQTSFQQKLLADRVPTGDFQGLQRLAVFEPCGISGERFPSLVEVTLITSLFGDFLSCTNTAAYRDEH